MQIGLTTVHDSKNRFAVNSPGKSRDNYTVTPTLSCMSYDVLYFRKKNANKKFRLTVFKSVTTSLFDIRILAVETTPIQIGLYLEEYSERPSNLTRAMRNQ